MKFVRSVVAVLILALACAPVLAAECASACAAADVMAKMPASATSADSAMAGCHMHDDKHQSNSGHKSCSMAGCHFTCAAPLAATAQVSAMDFTSVTLPQFDFFAVSADLTPPIKPPA